MMLYSLPSSRLGSLSVSQNYPPDADTSSDALTSEAKPLRILLVQPQAENAGAQEIARVVADGLSKRGHVTRQLFFFRRTAAFDADKSAVYCATNRPSHPLGLARLLWRYFREVRSFKPDVVLCFQHFGNLIGAPIARLAGATTIIANQNTAGMLTSKRVDTLDRWFGRMGLYNRIVTVSNDAEANFGSYPAGYRNRMLRIEHGVRTKTSELSREAARARFGLPSEAVVLGSAARLHPLKQLDAAVRLLPRDPAWHLALAGQGPEADKLKALALELGCSERLHLLDELDVEGMGDFFASLDVFVFPSLAETFGLAVVEAAQAGVPVVANRLPVLQEVLSAAGEPCAVFVDAANTTEFATAVAELIAAPERAAQLSARGRSLANRYPVDSMVASYDKLIRELVGARRAVRS
jgi:D-inositol-3-phosphate glycosyltransferase